MLLKREKGLNASSSSFSSPPRKLSVASTVSLDDSVLHTPTDEGEMSNLRMKNEEMVRWCELFVLSSSSSCYRRYN